MEECQKGKERLSYSCFCQMASVSFILPDENLYKFERFGFMPASSDYGVFHLAEVVPAHIFHNLKHS